MQSENSMNKVEMGPSPEAPVVDSNPENQQNINAKSKKPFPIFIFIIILLLLSIVATVIVFLLLNGKDQNSDSNDEPPTSTASPGQTNDDQTDGTEDIKEYSEKGLIFEYPLEWTVKVIRGDMKSCGDYYNTTVKDTPLSIELDNGMNSEITMEFGCGQIDWGPTSYFIDMVSRKYIETENICPDVECIENSAILTLDITSEINTGKIDKLNNTVAIFILPSGASELLGNRNTFFTIALGKYTGLDLWNNGRYVDLEEYQYFGSPVYTYAFLDLSCGKADKTSANVCIDALNVFMNSLKYEE